MPAVSGRGRGRRTINEINMVPFIDVMLVLLIIFMVTAPLITPSVINLPTVDRAAQRKDKPLEVVVDKNEVVRFSRSPVQGSTAQEYRLSELGQAVKAAQDGNGPRPVVISADKDVKYDVVVKVMRTLQDAGIERIGLSVTATGSSR